MNSEKRTCQNCKNEFTIEPDDFGFYEKIGVLPPKLCPACRAQLRLSFRNERVFYKRACDKCKKDVVSMYSPNKLYTVWCYDCWFSDDWDAGEYAREYDPSKPFFEQLGNLLDSVPRVALVHVRSVNSEYLNISADNKNCYMIVESSNNEDCTHCYWIQKCKDCVDVSFAHETELSYESDDCYSCYKIFWSKGCHDSRESYFLLNSRNCSDCIGCVNLRSKQYHIFNKPYSKEEYEKMKGELKLHTRSGIKEFKEKFEKFVRTQPIKYAEIYNSVDSTGNYIKNAKHCVSCFHCYDSEDCKYGVHTWRNAKDCVDCDTAGRNAELIYNSINAGIDTARHISSNLCWTCTEMDYSHYCFNSNFCFGCAGLRKKNYCILNKQYEKEEFLKLREEIISNMKKEGIYGDFFPSGMSAFGYNESAAQDQFPLTKEEAERWGFKWEDHPRGTYKKETVFWNQVSDSIRETELDVLKEIFVCTECEKNFRIIPGEYDFYKRMDIPLPDLCPDCRHIRRFTARGPNKLFSRSCQCGGKKSENGTYENIAEHEHGGGKCGNAFQTNFSPEKDEIIYCEECYQSEII